MTGVEVLVDPPYRVIVGSRLAPACLGLIPESHLAVVSDDNVWPLHGASVASALEDSGRRVERIAVPAGEDSKSLARLDGILRRMAAAGLARDAALLSVGGGVVSDLAGFAAACYLRGIPFYAMPTTLLAMVDASVGGKTGVNLPEGKNLVGAFWQPRLVVADVATLATLPDRAFREGAVELFKHGLLADERLLDALIDEDFRPGGDPDRLEYYVAASVKVKADVVRDDERESGNRAFLNLGHTLAHALEAVTDHRMSHGTAVAYGLAYAAILGRNRGWHDFFGQALELLTWLAPEPLPPVDFEPLSRYMMVDKKRAGGRVRFVLLRDVRTPVLVDDVGSDEQARAWRDLREATQ